MIEPGQPWGRQVDTPAGLVSIASDAELAEALSAPSPVPVLLAGGDLARGLGARPAIQLRGDAASADTSSASEIRRCRELPIDMLTVHLDDRVITAVAHVLIRSRGWLLGPILFIGNTGFVGRLEVVRRGHPNDGRFEVVEVDASMSPRQRIVGLRRMRAGTHLNHPLVTSTHASSFSRDFDRPRSVWVDGRRIGRVRRLAVEIIADAAVIYR